MAGAGVAKGKVIGVSDKIAGWPKERPVSPKDVLRTVYHLLGVDAERMLADRLGRPLPLVAGGEVLREALEPDADWGLGRACSGQPPLQL